MVETDLEASDFWSSHHILFSFNANQAKGNFVTQHVNDEGYLQSPGRAMAVSYLVNFNIIARHFASVIIQKPI